MQDWLKKKGYPLLMVAFAAWMIWDNVQWILGNRGEFFDLGVQLSGAFMGIMILISGIIAYLESHGKPALGQVVMIISGICMIISWQTIRLFHGDALSTWDNILVFGLASLMAIVGIFKLIRLHRGESIHPKKKTQVIFTGISIFLLFVLIIITHMLLFGVFR